MSLHTYECHCGKMLNSCGSPTINVQNYKLMNKEAKSKLAKKKLKQQDLEDVLSLIVSKGVKKIEITSNASSSIIDNLIKETYSPLKTEFKVEKEIDEQKLYNANILNNYKNTVILKFDSQGGSPVTEIVLKKNTTLDKIPKPTRKGYKFIAWEYKGKKYNFANKVEKSITLKAKWQKKKSN